MGWFRWHEGAVFDPKFRVLANLTHQPLAVVIAVFAALAERASANATERGNCSGWDAETIAAGLGVQAQDVASIHAAMQGRILTGDVFTAWSQRQPKREDGSAERAKAWREARKTHANDNERTQTPDKIREDKIRENPPLVPPLGEKVPSRGTRWPDGQAVPAEWLQGMDGYLAAKGMPAVELGIEAVKFANHWTAKAGATATKRDWQRAWMNWVLEASSRASGNRRRG